MMASRRERTDVGRPAGRDDLPGAEVLETWSQIAAYFDVSERTARRWAAQDGLPVHREGVVWARKPDLDRWWAHHQGIAHYYRWTLEAETVMELARRELEAHQLSEDLRAELRDLVDRAPE